MGVPGDSIPRCPFRKSTASSNRYPVRTYETDIYMSVSQVPSQFSWSVAYTAMADIGSVQTVGAVDRTMRAPAAVDGESD